MKHFNYVVYLFCISLCIYLSIHNFICLSIYLSNFYLSLRLFFYLHIFLFCFLSFYFRSLRIVFISIHLSIFFFLSIYLYSYLSFHLFVSIIYLTNILMPRSSSGNPRIQKKSFVKNVKVAIFQACIIIKDTF